MAKLVIGCGYLGLRVARRWQAAGDTVWVLTRKPERAAAFERQGFLAVVGDITESFELPGLTELDAVLFAVGFDRSAGKSIRQVYVAGLHRALQIVPPARQFIYISSTGVYGDCGGGWVDETATPDPATDGGRACLEAEGMLGCHPSAVLLRLAGIYGPGRIPKLADVVAGRPLNTDPAAILNLIHVEDAATAVQRAEEHGQAGRIYNVTDGNPVPRHEFYSGLAAAAAAPAPRFEPSGGGAPGRGSGSKRVSNARMLQELRVSLRYPTFQAGLPSCLNEAAEG